eukprot:9974121-Alexandrium_andersonii.AAC.1
MQHPFVQASQVLLQACHAGASSGEPDEDDCPRTPPGTLDAGMAGPRPELEPEDCLELRFARKASKFAYLA